MTGPDWITLSRFPLAGLFFAAMTIYSRTGEYEWRIFALILFSLAAISDFLDGWLARRWNCPSRLGAFLDPLADKLLALSVLWFLWSLPALNGSLSLPLVRAFCLLTIGRELLILGGIALLKIKKKTVEISPLKLGKWSTFLQFSTLSLLLLGIGAAGNLFLAVSIALLLLSGLGYLTQGLRIYKQTGEPR